MSFRSSLRTLTVTACMGLLHGVSGAAMLYANSFETDTSDWSVEAQRVASGTNGVTSSTGAFHAEARPGAFTRWGGYNYGAGNAVPTAFQEYRTSVDIYLNVEAAFPNDHRFDFSSAINKADGTHLRDFVISGGFFNSSDNTGPGAGTNRFIFNTSNNTPGWPQNPARPSIAIDDTGWYTFTHHFYDNGGVLAVDMEILDAADTVIGSWTLSDPTDLISSVGGNRYGWLVNSEISPLAIDNASLEVVDAGRVPEPASLLLVGLALAGLGVSRRRA